MRKLQLGCFIFALLSSLISLTAHAETVYTSLQDTVVRDGPADASPIIGHLPAGSMTETIKQVGAYTALSFIMDGKVKTGYVVTGDLRGEIKAPSAETVGVAPSEIAVPPAPPVIDPNAATSGKSAATSLAALQGAQVSPQALAAFAKNGNLVTRTAKRAVRK